MQKINEAMSKLNLAIDALNEAINEIEAENDRLFGTPTSDRQAQKADARCPAEESTYAGLRLVYDAAYRVKTTERDRRRTKARNGIPTELRDIL